jgi:hypothetical protein
MSCPISVRRTIAVRTADGREVAGGFDSEALARRFAGVMARLFGFGYVVVVGGTRRA